MSCLSVDQGILSPCSIRGLKSAYSVFLLDIVGVLYDQQAIFPGAIACYQQLVDAGKRIILLSNNPRPSETIQKSLIDKGFPASMHVITSGDAMRRLIDEKWAGKTVYHLGQHRNDALLQGMPVIETQDLNKADFVLLTLFTEEGERTDKWDAALKEIVSSGLPVYCPNPDVYALNGKAVRFTAGYYAQKIEKHGGKVIYVGKPHLPIYAYVWQKMGLTEKDKEAAVMVGDTLETDVVGAHNFHIKSHLVLSGNSGREATEKKLPIDVYLQEKAQQNKALMPTSYGASFTW